MPRDWDAEFADVGAQYYPGSSKVIGHVETKEKTTKDWDSQPRMYNVRGVETEFFTVGQLAMALGRQAVTVRKWEREGTIPKAQFIAPSNDPRGKRRLYTREQVEGMIRIAADEGVLLLHQKPIKETRFTERVIKLFQALAEQ